MPSLFLHDLGVTVGAGVGTGCGVGIGNGAGVGFGAGCGVGVGDGVGAGAGCTHAPAIIAKMPKMAITRYIFALSMLILF